MFGNKKLAVCCQLIANLFRELTASKDNEARLTKLLEDTNSTIKENLGLIRTLNEHIRHLNEDLKEQDVEIARLKEMLKGYTRQGMEVKE